MLDALVTLWHKGLKFEHTYRNIHWRRDSNQAAIGTEESRLNFRHEYAGTTENCGHAGVT